MLIIYRLNSFIIKHAKNVVFAHARPDIDQIWAQHQVSKSVRSRYVENSKNLVFAHALLDIDQIWSKISKCTSTGQAL